MQYIVIGNIGSDAGYWVLGPDGVWHHEGGWGVENLREVSAALAIMRETTQFRTPGLAESVLNSIVKFTDQQLGQHLKGGEGVVIIA